MDNKNAIEDLIYLFLDGEASETETNVLFSALAENKDVQKEFQEAVALQTSVNNVRNTIQPPLGLSASVFAAIDITDSTAIGVVQKGIISSAMQTVSIKALPIIGALITGSAITYGIMEYNHNISEKNHIAYSADNGDTLKNKIEHVHHNNKDIISSWSEESANDNNSVHNNNSEQEVGNKSAEHSFKKIQEHNYSLQNTSTSETVTEESFENTSQDNNIEAPSIDITNVVLKDNDIAVGFSANNEISHSNHKAEEIIIPKEFSLIPTRIWIKSLAGLYQNSKTEGNYKGKTDNINATVLWDVGKAFYLGFEAGNEFLPTYVIVNNQEQSRFIRDENVVWAAATLWVDVDKKIEYIRNDYMNYFTSVSIGASDAGPLCKAQFGISFMPINDFHIGSSVDATMLALSGKGGWQSTYRTGISLLVGFNL